MLSKMLYLSNAFSFYLINMIITYAELKFDMKQIFKTIPRD